MRGVLLSAFLVSLPVSSWAEEWQCWQDVEQRYGVPSSLLYAIAKQESGLNPNAVNKSNANGSRDVGLMQINSSWFKKLARHGIYEQDLFDPCVNLHVGAWILADNIARMGYGWRAVGAYNAKSEHKRVKYAANVQRHLASFLKHGR